MPMVVDPLRAADCFPANAAGVPLNDSGVCVVVGRRDALPAGARPAVHVLAGQGLQAGREETYFGRPGLGLFTQAASSFAPTPRDLRVYERAGLRPADVDGFCLLYDTFHAHIEEKDPAAVLDAVYPTLMHFHASENDRSTPGRGQVRWAQTLAVLRRRGWDGVLMVEAFGMALPALAAATRIWRPMFDTPEELARDAIAFLRSAWDGAAARSAARCARRLRGLERVEVGCADGAAERLTRNSDQPRLVR